MAQTLNVPNYRTLNIVTTTKLTADIAAAQNSLPVQNSALFVAGPVLVGAAGSETAELVTSTIPIVATAIPCTNTKLAHNVYDPVYMLFGDSIKVYSAPDSASALPGTGQQPPDTAFTLITGGTVLLSPSVSNTRVTDGNGTPGTWYKYTYYNSVTFAETAIADSKAVQVGVVHYVTLDQIRRAAGFTTSPNVTDDIIAEFRDAAEKEINGALQPVYSLPLPLPTNPIVLEIAKNIAAGELKHEMYQDVSLAMAAEGEGKADAARHGGGSHTSLDELVTREVVLQDANFVELTLEEGHGFGGYPDDSTQGASSDEGGDHGHQFKIDEVY